MFRLLIALLVVSCPLRAEPLQVVADIAPVHSLVARVMQGAGVPSLAIPPGASPHGYAMRPSEARALSQADVVIWIGPELTPWLQNGLDTLAGDAVHLALADVPDTVLHPLREGALFDAHDHDQDHDDHEDHDDHDEHADHEEHHDFDPHSWLDPRNGAVWLGAIADQLGLLDPENAALYRANAVAGRAELAELEAQIAQTLSGLQTRPFVVFHDAYHYFEARFEVEAVAAISLSDASAPSAAQVAQVRDVIADQGVVCVFAEPQSNPGLISSVTEQQLTKAAVLDPLGRDQPLGPMLYAKMLRQMANAMDGCLRP
ncbi:MAG: zinc ABC transporter substrate-binding protein [Sulfitobacter sp.]